MCKSRHVGRPVMPRRRSTCNGQSSHHPRKRSSQCRTDGSRCPLQRNVCRPSAYQPIRRCAELCDCFHLVRRRDRLFIRLLRFGDCVAACNFDAIHINLETGLPEVDEDKCTSCGACVKACPKNIIELRKKGPKSRRVFVSCVNKDKGGVAKKACANACIGCGKCAKECPFEAITVENNVAYIDYTKCRLCRKCVAVCPTGAIHELNFPPRKEAAPAVDADKIKPATAPKPAAPKADTPKTEAPKKESPKAEAPTANATPNAETPKIETKEETIQK